MSELDLHCPRCIAPGRAALMYQLAAKLQQFKTVGPASHKPLLLIGLLQTLKGERSIVFSSRKATAHRAFILLDILKDLVGPCFEYSQLLTLYDRKRNLQRFQTEDGAILVASDGMSRWMDVHCVENIINYDTPLNVKMYIRRAGHAARAHPAGRVFSLLRRGIDEAILRKILRKLGQGDVSVVRPDVENLKPTVEKALAGVRDVVSEERKGGEEGKATDDLMTSGSRTPTPRIFRCFSV
eukprot:evm.model.scf_3872.1 EVM.evm.TU.scf_3872.1   scf_3872:942-2575(+)